MPTVLCTEPMIVVHEDYITPEEREKLIAIGAANEARSSVIDNETGDSFYGNYRTGKMSYTKKDDPVIVPILKRMTETTNVRNEQIEGLQVLRYGIGDQYLPHEDWFHPGSKGSQKVLRFGGQRIISFVACLKEPEEGGAIDFPRLKITHKLKAGDAIFFWNIMKNGKGDMRAEHAAMPVIKGEKISLVTWIRERAYDGSEEKSMPPSEAQVVGMLQQHKNIRQMEAGRQVEAVLKNLNCGVRITAVPFVDPRTGMIMVKPEFRIESR